MMNNSETLRKMYLKCRTDGIKVEPHTAAIAIRAVGDYGTIRGTYHDSIYEAITSYLDGRVGIATGSGMFKKACAAAFVDAFETGFIDTQGSGATYDPALEDSDWLATRMQQEFAFIDSTFQTMKAMIADTENPLTEDEIVQYANNRAEGYCATLDGVYSQGKLRSRRNVVLTLDGPDGKESCTTCQKYKGQRHRASWWISRDLIPAPGNDNYECGGWQCQHVLSDDSGNQWSGTE
jgi:hypothetical protein